MGLSNEERITKAFWASNKITNLGHEIDPESDDFGWETRKNVTLNQKTHYKSINQ